jgi:2-isopropylmalate synthase
VVADIRLVDYKVRVLEPNCGTAAKVRVLIEWADHKRSWTTVGVSDDVLEARWNALVDSIRLELLRLAETDKSMDKTVADYSWGV